MREIGEIQRYYGTGKMVRDEKGKYVRIEHVLELIQKARDEEARDAADRVEMLPYRDHGRTVNRNDAILAARRGLLR